MRRKMYKKKNPEVLEFKDFYQPFGGKMNADNRWIKMADIVPWDVLEEKYARHFKALGRGAKKVRMAIGALLIQQRFGYSDEETVEQIIENPYLQYFMQYFIGLPEYQGKKPFDASMMVYFRKRVTPEMLEEANRAVFAENVSKKDDDDDGPKNKGLSSQHGGKLIVDATCVPSDIKYPTDLNLLNEGREKLEKMIDVCYDGEKKPRTYRKKARRDYLRAAKNRRLSVNNLKKAIRKQLNYVKRDLNYLENKELDRLGDRERKEMETIKKLYAQQKQMYDNMTHSVSNRIVSISQPHIRPIVRGKAGADVEFGAKVTISLIDGFAFIDRIDFENFNEGTVLKRQAEAYRERIGVYPEELLADGIYRTRENLNYCKERGIRLSGPQLGRPTTDEVERVKQKKQEKKDTSERNAVEGEYGTGKRKLNLGLIMTKLPETSIAVIGLNFFLMNLEKKLRLLLLVSSAAEMRQIILRWFGVLFPALPCA